MSDMDIHISGLDESALREVRDRIDEILGDSDDDSWPYDEMVIPMTGDKMNEEEWEDADKIRHTPPYGLRFRMPSSVNDFSCHECGGKYGPWIHKDFFHHGVFDRSIGETRVRRCQDCGHIHHNSYSIGEYNLVEDDDSTVLRLE